MAILGIGAVSPATAADSGLYSFGFKSFTLADETNSLDIECDLSICLLDDSGNQLDSSCGTC